MSFVAERSAAAGRSSPAGGIVTAPISKTAWAMAGLPYRDHTEYFREQTQATNVQMILGLPARKRWSVVATRHVPLAQVSRLLTRDRLLDAARGLRDALRSWGIPRPQLGLCGFNPHAGEEKLLGREESAVLAPAVPARALGLA